MKILLLFESERVVAKIEIDINNQLIEEYSNEASKKKRQTQKEESKVQKGNTTTQKEQIAKI